MSGGLSDGLRRTLGIVGTTGTGVAGGIFLAFSTMVGPALRRLQEPRRSPPCRSSTNALLRRTCSSG
jgi:uncharacterized membrane protein